MVRQRRPQTHNFEAGFQSNYREISTTPGSKEGPRSVSGRGFSSAVSSSLQTIARAGKVQSIKSEIMPYGVTYCSLGPEEHPLSSWRRRFCNCRLNNIIRLSDGCAAAVAGAIFGLDHFLSSLWPSSSLRIPFPAKTSRKHPNISKYIQYRQIRQKLLTSESELFAFLISIMSHSFGYFGGF